MDWRNYDQDTQRYENYSNKRFIKDFIVPLLRPGCTVLDIGCGPGATTHNSLLPELPQDGTLYGMDADPFLVSTAKNNYQNSGIHFLHMDAVDIGRLEVNFDVMVSMFCIHLIKDQKRFWKQMASKLKDDGVIVMHTLAKNVFCDSVVRLSNKKEYEEALAEAKNRYADYIYSTSQEEAEKMLKNQIREALPDCDITFCLTNHAFRYETKEQFYLNVQGDNHYRNRMDDGLAARYVKDLMGSIQELQGLQKDDYTMALAMYEITVKKNTF